MSNLKTVAKFEKVSFDRFKKDVMNLSTFFSVLCNCSIKEEDIEGLYNSIILPKRSSVGSAGYDIFNPINTFTLHTESAIVVPTGLKCYIDDGWFLDINPRSGMGFKYHMHLANTRGIIDSDYYNNEDNEGHIMIKIVNGGVTDVKIYNGKAFAQGIFTVYGITYDDDTTDIRKGGLGSSDK